jgi:hypothetical protein
MSNIGGKHSAGRKGAPGKYYWNPSGSKSEQPINSKPANRHERRAAEKRRKRAKPRAVA